MQVPDSVLLDGYDEETVEMLVNDTISAKTGTYHFLECHASITVPEGFVFLDRDEAKRLMTVYWDNPEERASDLLGALVPSYAKAYYQIDVAYFISFDNCGYIKDDDANSIDYDEMMKNIQEGEKEENEQIPEEYRLTTLRWEFAPKYLAGSHVLVWAKRLASSSGSEVVNYDMRLLSKDGLVSIMAVVDPYDSEEVKQREQSVINCLSFDEGYAYADFDPSRDRVSEWTLGGLVIGSILAKSGFFAKVGLILLKGWKLIALAVAGIGGAWFKKKKKKQETNEEK